MSGAAFSPARSIAVAAFLAGTSIALAASANDVTVPASITMKVYRFGLSTSPTCENMQIYTVEAPAFVDFTTNPTLSSAEVPHGTYPCIALELDHILSGTPRTNGGNCTTDKQLRYDYCQLLEVVNDSPPPPRGSMVDGGTPEAPQDILDGLLPLGGDASQLSRTCKSPTDPITVYLTTQVPADAVSNAFRPPTSPTDARHGFHLGAPLVVTERTTGTFVVTSVANSSNESDCELGGATFSFESGESP